MGNRGLLVTATVVIMSVLLLASFGMIMSAYGDTSHGDRQVQVSGVLDTQRSYFNGPPFPVIAAPYSVTVIDYNVLSVQYDGSGNHVGNGNTLTTLAVDTTGIGRASGTGTFWGTVGDSKPGFYTFIDTFTIDTTQTPAPVTGNLVIVQGSGMGGLVGICGTETFQGAVNLATGAGVFTYNLEAQFGNSCSQSNAQSG